VPFLIGDLEVKVGKGMADKLRVDFLEGEREGEDGGPGSKDDEMAEGEQEARVRVRADILGVLNSGISAKGMDGSDESSS
jgi:hypothetical protein